MKSHALTSILVIVVASLTGCDTSASDMGEQPKAKAQAKSAYFSDGASARPLVAGTVARPDDTVPGMPYARTRTAAPSGAVDVVPLDTRIPVSIDRALVERGQAAFMVNCVVCHGQLGNGEGMVVQRGFSPPPSFHARRLVAAPDAHFYNVITAGYGAMFSYSERVTPEDRWAIVAYVRALQAAGGDLGPAERTVLRPDYDPNAPKGTLR